MSEKGWQLLHKELPPKALKTISKDVYGVDGLTDVNEGYLITRLFASELKWSWQIIGQSYLGCEDRAVRNKDYTNRYYLASVHGRLTIGDQTFDGSGAHDNRKIDAAFKGAATVAFKNAAKTAGLFMQLLMEGRAIDFIYETRDGAAVQPEVTPGPPAEASSTSSEQQSPAPADSTGKSPDSVATPSETAPRSSESSAKVVLEEKQATVVKWLIEKLPEADRDEAKQAAWAKMQAAAVRDVKTAWVAGVDELIRRHGGPESDLGKAIAPKIAALVAA